jgi:hypothetical protein
LFRAFRSLLLEPPLLLLLFLEEDFLSEDEVEEVEDLDLLLLEDFSFPSEEREGDVSLSRLDEEDVGMMAVVEIVLWNG